jgi:hypothetical protein
MPNPSTTTNFTPLTPIQMQVLQSLASGSTVSAAAEQAGLHRSTIYLWTRTIPGFNQVLADLRQQRASRLVDELGDLADLAIDTFRHILSDDKAPPAARLKAAMEIVKMVDAQRATAPKAEEPTPAPAVAERSQSASQAPAAVGRNSACPCGSNLKYKRCCGDPFRRKLSSASQLSPTSQSPAPKTKAYPPESAHFPEPEMALPAPPH